MNALPRRLWVSDRSAILRHLLALPLQDRRLRFGGHLSDNGLAQYVANINISRDAVFGISEDGVSLAAVAHLARSAHRAELGLSVLPSNRNRGLGRCLLKRSYVHGRNRSMSELRMHCLASNGDVIRLARSLNMQIVAEFGDAEAWIEVPMPDFASFMTEAFDDCAAHSIYTCQLAANAAVDLMRTWTMVRSPVQSQP